MDEKKEMQCALYEALLYKYRDLINAKERKTVGEVKAIVNPMDLTVQVLVERFKNENYSFPQDYLAVLEKLYNYLLAEVRFTTLDIDINYSLTPTEIMKHKIADDWDSAVFLCSIMKLLGDDKAAVIVWELENFATHAVATTENGGKFLLLDPLQGKPFAAFSGDKKAVIENYTFEGKKIKRPAYRFNDQEYEHFPTLPEQ